MIRAYSLPLYSACSVLLSCVVASVDAVQIEPAAPCELASANTAGWQEVDAGPFLIRLPAGYRKIDVHGIDSLVGRWELSAIQLVTFDWGQFSDDLSRAGMQLNDLVACTETIDGYPARVVMGFDSPGTWHGGGQKFVVAAAWRTIGALTLTATGNKSDVPTLFAIIRSVVFKTR